MSTYVICENNGVVIGTFADLDSAQTESQTLADAYAAGDPDLAVQNTSTYYVCIRTRSISRDNSGITLVTNQQSIDKTWKITTLTAP
uniref:Uncharacterized protein n=1 Tax=Marseillevirus LCMAC101 TaxID=2506602 RepID=A0A481YRY3_9VIRU|nr:MAG: hypothetical protein LCMAC101_00720 [Marseillevirus LCMAC101]